MAPFTMNNWINIPFGPVQLDLRLPQDIDQRLVVILHLRTEIPDILFNNIELLIGPLSSVTELIADLK